MSFKSTAQDVLFTQPSDESMANTGLENLIEVEEPTSHHHGGDEETLEVIPTENPIEITIELTGDLPGAEVSPEEPLMVHEHEHEHEQPLEVVEEQKVDENQAKKSKKSEKWDWESKGAKGFLPWIKERFDTVPKHSGYDSAGLERATSYLEKLDAEISRAMRMDLEGELDANKVEEIRAKIDDGIERLHERLDKVKEKKKGKRKKSSEAEYEGFIKDAQKITGIQGIYIVAPLFASRIARICINGMVSAGHDIEDTYSRQVKKWKLTDREQAEVMQLLADMGYPLRQDRGYMPDEEVDVSSSDNFDWAANYKG